MNRNILITLASIALGASAVAQAGNGNGHGYGYGRDRHQGRDMARVLHVEPLVERVRYSVPVEQCWDEHQVRRQGNASGAIVGGVVGAMLGSAVGKDGNRNATTVGGALLGAAIGSNVGNGGRERHSVRQVCEVHDEARWEERVVAYRVTYVYNGRRDVARMDHDPGRYFRLADARRWG